MNASQPLAIKKIVIEKLFNQYSYVLPEDNSKINDLTRVLILYGDNGSGKTTILKLIYHLLSSSGVRGHRTEISNTIFKKIEVSLTNDFMVTAERNEDELIGTYSMSLHKGRSLIDKIVFEAMFDKNKDKYVVSARTVKEEDEKVRKFLNHLENIGINYFFLSDEREFASDIFDLEDLEGSLEIREVGGRRRNRGTTIEQMRIRNMHLARDRINDDLNSQIYQALSKGETDANKIYSDIAQSITTSSNKSLVEKEEKTNMIRYLKELSERTSDYSSFNMTPILDVDAIVDSIERSTPEATQILIRVLEPYVNGIKAKLDALKEAYDLLNVFTNTLNGFYSNKSVEFDYPIGLRINAKEEYIRFASLSSGEKQLLTLFCNTISAREYPSIFIIDEPEISLNVKWQRALISALLELTKGCQVQFILATHSMELLTLYKKNVVKLVSIE